MSDNNTEQTKTGSTAKYYAGAAEENLGKLVGSDKMKLEGESKKLEGQSEYEGAKNQGYVEGTTDKVTGTVKETAGNVVNDDQMKAEGNVKKNKGDTQQYGGSEVAKNYEGKKSTKWLFEADLKLPKVLKDMLLLLNSHISDMKERRKLITIGYIHGGLQLMFMTLDNPAGYVFRLVKSSLYNIPVSFQNFTEALELIAAVWTMKIKFYEDSESLIDLRNRNNDVLGSSIFSQILPADDENDDSSDEITCYLATKN
nr:13869_t:CDS:2 [Entrophospora candida]